MHHTHTCSIDSLPRDIYPSGGRAHLKQRVNCFKDVVKVLRERGQPLCAHPQTNRFGRDVSVLCGGVWTSPAGHCRAVERNWMRNQVHLFTNTETNKHIESEGENTASTVVREQRVCARVYVRVCECDSTSASTSTPVRR